jgi:hypothetical protein
MPKPEVDVRRCENQRARYSKRLILLRVDRPCFFVVEGNAYFSKPTDTEEDAVSHATYYYDEHTCPTNWTDNIVAVIQDGDDDPHGFARFVRMVESVEDYDDCDFHGWEELFPEAFGEPTTIDGIAEPGMRIALPPGAVGVKVYGTGLPESGTFYPVITSDKKD